MKKNLKKALSFALVLLMLVGLTACTEAPAADNDAAETPQVDASTADTDTEKRVLRVAGESWQVTKIFLEDAAAAFMEAHPDVTVEVITYADTSVLSTYSLDWANGTTDVDLVFLDGTMYAQQFAAKGLISDWETDLKFFDNYSADNFVENVVDFGRINDSLVLMPIIYEVNGINVNIPMFKEAGLVDADGNPLQPETWEEFYEFAKKLTIVDESGAVIQQGASINFGGNMMSSVASTLAAANGRIVGDDGITMDFDNENFREILAIWKQGVADGYFSIETFADTSAARNAYKAGNLAMCFESGSRWMEAAETLGIENVSVLDVPGFLGNCGNTNGVVVPKCSENADLAVQFVQEQLLGEHVQTNTYASYGKMSVIKEYYDSVVSGNAVWANLDRSSANALPIPPYEQISLFKDELKNIIQDGLLNKDVDTIIDELVTMVESIH